MLQDILAGLPAELSARLPEPGDDVGVFFREAADLKLVRPVVASMTWDQVMTLRGAVVNAVSNDPGLGHDLVERPDCGILFAAEILAAISAGQIAQMPAEGLHPYHLARRDLALKIVGMIRAGHLTRRETDPVEAHWLLTRLAADFDRAGPPWRLDPAMVETVAARAKRDFEAGESGVAVEDGFVRTGELLQHAATRKQDVRLHPAHPLARAERLLRRALSLGRTR